MKKTIKTILIICCISLLLTFGLTACKNECTHIYDNACDVTCNECGEERKVTHDFADADCLNPKTCTVCGKTEGSALGHEWTTPDADLCEVQSTCSRCGATEEKTRSILPRMMITTAQPPLIAVFAEKKFWRQASIPPKRMTAIAQQSKNAPYAVKWRLQRRMLIMTPTTTTFATTQAVR